jgi:hypothetical protein
MLEHFRMKRVSRGTALFETLCWPASVRPLQQASQFERAVVVSGRDDRRQALGITTMYGAEFQTEKGVWS